LPGLFPICSRPLPRDRQDARLEEIDVFVLDGCDDVKNLRMVEISENLHRMAMKAVFRGR
jgi:hypothetical protein